MGWFKKRRHRRQRNEETTDVGPMVPIHPLPSAFEGPANPDPPHSDGFSSAFDGGDSGGGGGGTDFGGDSGGGDGGGGDS